MFLLPKLCPNQIFFKFSEYYKQPVRPYANTTISQSLPFNRKPKSTMKTENVSRYADRYIRNVAQRAATVLSDDQRARITGQLREYMYSNGHVEPTHVKKCLRSLVFKALNAERQGTDAAAVVEEEIIADAVVGEEQAQLSLQQEKTICGDEDCAQKAALPSRASTVHGFLCFVTKNVITLLRVA